MTLVFDPFFSLSHLSLGTFAGRSILNDTPKHLFRIGGHRDSLGRGSSLPWLYLVKHEFSAVLRVVGLQDQKHPNPSDTAIATQPEGGSMGLYQILCTKQTRIATRKVTLY